MPEIVGGLRDRLVRDSIYYLLHGSLGQLGWFNAGRQHRPINLIAEPVPANQEIPLNTLVLADEDLLETPLELGSNGVITSWHLIVDFYAQNDTLGRHLINDVRDILGGRMPSIGRTSSSIAVLDYRLATPVTLFYVDVDDILVDRAHDFPKAWQQHWYACSFSVTDAYYGDDT